MIADHPEFGREGLIAMPWSAPQLAAAPAAAIGYPIRDFYLTNPIARSSPTMRRCSAELVHGLDYAEAAE